MWERQGERVGCDRFLHSQRRVSTLQSSEKMYVVKGKQVAYSLEGSVYPRT